MPNFLPNFLPNLLTNFMQIHTRFLHCLSSRLLQFVSSICYFNFSTQQFIHLLLLVGPNKLNSFPLQSQFTADFSCWIWHSTSSLSVETNWWTAAFFFLHFGYLFLSFQNFFHSHAKLFLSSFISALVQFNGKEAAFDDPFNVKTCGDNSVDSSLPLHLIISVDNSSLLMTSFHHMFLNLV